MNNKKMFKIGFSMFICLVVLASSCLSVFADGVSYTTKTEYIGSAEAPKVVVSATASNVSEGDMITYVAYKGSADETGIVYINQAVSDSNNKGTVTFNYTTSIDNITTTKVFGGTTSGNANDVASPVKGDMYSAKLVIDETESVVYFDKYQEGTTPYVIAREFSLGGYNGAVVDVLVNDESVDFVLNDGVVTMLTDKIAADGCVIKVLTSLPFKTSVSLGTGTANADGSITLNCKSDLNDNNEFGVIVSKSTEYTNILNLAEIDDSFTWTEDVAIAFPALGKNENGVYAMQFSDFDAGEYFFSAYVIHKSQNTYTIDSKDINGQTVSHTF